MQTSTMSDPRTRAVIKRAPPTTSDSLQQLSALQTKKSYNTWGSTEQIMLRHLAAIFASGRVEQQQH
jgi:hypothetical protein